MHENEAATEDREHDATTGVELSTLTFDAASARHKLDSVAVESPLEIRLMAGDEGRRALHPLAVTMRTPGDDVHLALGFLLAEGIIRDPGDVESARVDPPAASGEPSNRVTISLDPAVAFDPEAFTRNVYTGSSCGICGASSIEHVLAVVHRPPVGRFQLDRATLCALPDRLLGAQEGFARTGGVHAAGLFRTDGTMLVLREDVGRHNAVDKVVGERFRRRALPLDDTVLLVSGRAGFELVHKAAVAGIPLLAAVGAPSSLAVRLAKQVGMTLVGFLRGARFNVYCGIDRIETG